MKTKKEFLRKELEELIEKFEEIEKEKGNIDKKLFIK